VAVETGLGLGATVAVSVGTIVSVGTRATVSVAEAAGSLVVVGKSWTFPSVLKITSSSAAEGSTFGEQAARTKAMTMGITINLSFVIDDTSTFVMIVALAEFT
jgi:hypothetical protein